MLAHYWYYQIWSNRLKRMLVGQTLLFAISFDKDNLYLEFESGVLWCRFVQQELWFQWLEDVPSRNAKKKNGQVQFKELHGKGVASIECLAFDRFMEIRFDSDLILGFKGFGRQSNVLLNEKGEVSSIFRLSCKGDWDFSWPDTDSFDHLPSGNAESWQDFLQKRRSPANAKNTFPFEAASQADLPSIINWLNRLSDAQIEEEIELSVDSWDQWHLPEQTLNWARKLMFEREKVQRLSQLQQRIRQLQALVIKSKNRLEELENRRSYRELGDLILAHAHHLKQGISSARIPDFYTGEQLRIKLDPELNAADNAKRYYKKAQNQPLEMQERRLQISRSEESLAHCKRELEQWEMAVDFKDIKGLRSKRNEPSAAAEANNRPFKVLDWQGYQIWMGKSSKSNDELLRASSKNDLWFHAKGVTGSHVLIRRTGQDFSSAVIEHAAHLAALHSKAKHQGFVPVQMALRKFVIKPKGAAPGEVLVQKEQVVDVYLN
jgi:predicted ribosome quality control (RQC) complex YloA/Tae2 family protein